MRRTSIRNHSDVGNWQTPCSSTGMGTGFRFILYILLGTSPLLAIAGALKGPVSPSEECSNALVKRDPKAAIADFKSWLASRPEIKWTFRPTYDDLGLFMFPPGNSSPINMFALELNKDFNNLSLTYSPQLYDELKRNFGATYISEDDTLFDGLVVPASHNKFVQGLVPYSLDLSAMTLKSFDRNSRIIKHELIHVMQAARRKKGKLSIFHTTVVGTNSKAIDFFHGGILVFEELLAFGREIRDYIEILDHAKLTSFPGQPIREEMFSETPREHNHELAVRATRIIDIVQMFSNVLQDLRQKGSFRGSDLVLNGGQVWFRLPVNSSLSGRSYVIAIPLIRSRGLDDPLNRTDHLSHALNELQQTMVEYNKAAGEIIDSISAFEQEPIPNPNYGQFIRGLKRAPWF